MFRFDIVPIPLYSSAVPWFLNLCFCIYADFLAPWTFQLEILVLDFQSGKKYDVFPNFFIKFIGIKLNFIFPGFMPLKRMLFRRMSSVVKFWCMVVIIKYKLFSYLVYSILQKTQLSARKSWAEAGGFTGKEQEWGQHKTKQKNSWETHKCIRVFFLSS